MKPDGFVVLGIPPTWGGVHNMGINGKCFPQNCWALQTAMGYQQLLRVIGRYRMVKSDVYPSKLTFSIFFWGCCVHPLYKIYVFESAVLQMAFRPFPLGLDQY